MADRSSLIFKDLRTRILNDTGPDDRTDSPRKKLEDMAQGRRSMALISVTERLAQRNLPGKHYERRDIIESGTSAQTQSLTFTTKNVKWKKFNSIRNNWQEVVDSVPIVIHNRWFSIPGKDGTPVHNVVSTKEFVWALRSVEYGSTSMDTGASTWRIMLTETPPGPTREHVIGLLVSLRTILQLSDCELIADYLVDPPRVLQALLASTMKDDKTNTVDIISMQFADASEVEKKFIEMDTRPKAVRDNVSLNLTLTNIREQEERKQNNLSID